MVLKSTTTPPENPLVTIIALCYNQAKFAEETLDSILAQTYSNIQLIIMDDASTDNSVDVINTWIESNKVDCTFIPHKENKGICKTLNEALSFAKGKYLQMVACDDIYFPNKTEKLVYFLENNKQYVATYTDAILIKEDSYPHYGLFIQRHRNFSDIPDGYIYDILIEGNFIPAMSTLILTSVIKELNGWDENLDYEDYDMWLRIAEKYKFGLYHESLVKYRLHSNNIHKTIQFQRHNLKIYKKHINNPLAREIYQSNFFDLFKNNMITSQMRVEYSEIFSESKLAFLIKYGFSYTFYKMIIKFIS